MKRVAPLYFVLLLVGSPARANLLGSWNDGEAKRSIVEFVMAVTAENAPTYVPPQNRIAVFDNDGTLWAEQPMFVHFLFAMDRVKAMAPQHPEWATKVPFNHLLNGDTKAFMAQDGETALAAVTAELHSGMTTDEYERIVKDWLKTARHPQTGRLYTQMAYEPMLELLAYLRSNGFKTFIVAVGGADFLRCYAEQTYGIPPEQVIASTEKLKYEMRNGKPVLVKTAEMQFVNRREGKVIGIQNVIGRRPIAAFGNSDVDLQMLQWTRSVPVGRWDTSDPTPRLVMVIHHTDSMREWAYDRKNSIGTLDEVLKQAKPNGWIVVDMRDDWNTIYPPLE